MLTDDPAENLVKIGASMVRHGRDVLFQLAEVVVARGLFANPAAHRPQFIA